MIDRATPGPVNLDDQDYIESVLKGFGLSTPGNARSELRGGERLLSETWSEPQVEIEVRTKSHIFWFPDISKCFDHDLTSYRTKS